MKLHLLLITAFVALTECQAGQLAFDKNTSNGTISNEYASLCIHWVAEMERLLPQPPATAMKAIKTVTCLRCRSASRSMLDMLNYPIGPLILESTNTWGKQKVKEFIPGYAPQIGDFKLIGTWFPMYAFLHSIGFDFQDFISVLGKYRKDQFHLYDTVFCNLGASCAGRYFPRYCLDKDESITPQLFDNFPTPTSKERVLGPASDEDLKRFSNSRRILFWHGADAETYTIYTNMQSTLLARFSEEQNSASENLADTIATMGFIRSLDAIPVLADNLTICPQASTNAPGGFVFPAAEALIAIGPAIGDCFARLKATKPLSVEEALWLRISHELYPEGLEYKLYCAAQTNDTRAARLMQSLPWRRLSEDDMKDP